MIKLSILYYFSVREMDASLVYQRLQQYFPSQFENMNVGQLNVENFMNEKDTLCRKFPFMSLNQVHAICRNQEKIVMNRIIEIKKKDIYQEMNEVSQHKDLQNLQSFSTEEIHLKIQQYSSEMNVLQEKAIEHETDQLSSQMLDQHMEDERDEDSQRELKHIFEEYDHLPWNELGIYDLH